MIVTIDVGNSNIVLGAHGEGGNIRFVSRIATDTRREADQYAAEMAGILDLYGLASEQIEGVAVASVVPAINRTLLKALSHFTTRQPMLLQLAHAEAMGINVCIDNPSEIGTDILASAIAVKGEKPMPAVIIDMGTATKLVGLDENASLQGVSIAPGLYLSLNALVKNASALSGIALEAPAHAAGKNTAESMRSGLVLGTASMLDGMIERFEAEVGTAATVIATGGASQVVVPHCKHKVEYSETLLLHGLYKAFMAAQ